jgi:predicted DNA-binding transcriptional regulator YafY
MYKAKSYSAIEPYRLVSDRGIWYLAAIEGGVLKKFRHFSDETGSPQ